jgi:hypothetical protein
LSVAPAQALKRAFGCALIGTQEITIEIQEGLMWLQGRCEIRQVPAEAQPTPSANAWQKQLTQLAWVNQITTSLAEIG